ncbi:hypothetical protein L1049_007338 [Liquidambar formosana]|uniref:SHSP domain-containing protein n=1 Tax=Liquidambar formosana TaxID=63359 RepID=A0AAP0RH42_LIQFO
MCTLFWSVTDICNNPFLSAGANGAFSELHSDEEGLRLRIDMPGVGKDGLRVWVKNESVFFKGKELTEDDAEEARHYSGSVDILYGYDVNEVKASIQNGVLKIKMPIKKDLQNRNG